MFSSLCFTLLEISVIQEMAKRAKKIGANTRTDTSSLGSLRKIKGNRAIKERANTFFMMGILMG